MAAAGCHKMGWLRSLSDRPPMARYPELAVVPQQASCRWLGLEGRHRDDAECGDRMVCGPLCVPPRLC